MPTRGASWSSPSTSCRRATRSTTARCAGGSTPAGTARSPGPYADERGRATTPTGRRGDEFHGVTQHRYRRDDPRPPGRRDDPARGRAGRSTSATSGWNRPRSSPSGSYPEVKVGVAIVANAKHGGCVMHELGLCEDIVAAVEQRAAGRTVARFGCGSAASITSTRRRSNSPSPWRRRAGWPTAPAPNWSCSPCGPPAAACGADAEADELIAVCPTCGSFDVELTGGDELVLELLEYASATADRLRGARHVSRHPRPRRRAGRRQRPSRQGRGGGRPAHDQYRSAGGRGTLPAGTGSSSMWASPWRGSTKRRLSGPWRVCN